MGATFDVSALYRFIAVQEWLAQQNMTVAGMLAHVRGIERVFLALSRSNDVTAATLLVPDEASRGRFLAFRTSRAGAIVKHLAEHNIIADHRGDRLRIGFGVYHTAADARRLATVLI